MGAETQHGTTPQPVFQPQGLPSKWTATPTEYFVQEAEHHHEPTQSWFQEHFGGLKRTLRFFLAVAIIVLLVNIAWLIYVKTHYGGIDVDSGVIQRGDCDAANPTNTWLHLLINILSILLLTGSNAFMSTYCCPSRKEVDKAHTRQKWLHVGMLSLRNLGKISKRKSFVVVLLGLSSLPFHLLYNSLVFVSLSANSYYYIVATAGFQNGQPHNLTGPLSNSGGTPHWMVRLPDDINAGTVTYVPYYKEYLLGTHYAFFDEVQVQKNARSWEKLSNRDERNETTSVLNYGTSELSGGALDNNWRICSRKQDGGSTQCQPDDFVTKADEWSVWRHPINYCLSERLEKEVCEVEFSMDIMIVVIVFNLVKVLAMTWVLLRYNAEEILTTVGDSIVSFLTREDGTTRGMCLSGWHDIKHYWNHPTGIMYRPHRHRWARALSKGKWALFITLMLLSFLIVAIFGGWGFSHTRKRGNSLSPSSLWSLGFGAAHQDAIVIYDRTDSLVRTALLANIPQIFLAAVWLLYMVLLAADWARFATKPQPLLVKTARGSQRGTWLLGVPLVYGVPLLILHWLVSQSIFVISLNIYNPDGTPKTYHPNFLNCGYSPIAIIFTIVAAVLLMLSAIVMAYRKFPEGAPPVVVTCSVAISAACHLLNGMLRQGDLYGKMKWGQCGQMEYRVGHCVLVPEEWFESGFAQALVTGWTYS